MLTALSVAFLAMLPRQDPVCTDSVKAVSDSSLPWVHLVEHLACERTVL